MNAEQPPLNATFFAFKKRDRRLVLTGAAIAYCVAVLGVSAIFIAASWQIWSQAISWYVGVVSSVSSGNQPAPPSGDLVLRLAPLYLVFIPISLLLFSLFEAACLRWMIRGEAGGGFLGLKFDADTWRVFGVYWIWIAYLVVAVIATALFYVLVAALSSVGGAARFIAILIGTLAPVGIAALLIWGGVLFAPAAAASVGRRRFTFFAARKISSPRYWPLLTSFFLVIVGYLIVSTIMSTILQIPMSTAMASVMQQVLAGADGADALRAMQEAFLTPFMIGVFAVNVVASFVLSIVYYIAMFGVNARAFEAAAEAGDVERA